MSARRLLAKASTLIAICLIIATGIQGCGLGDFIPAYGEKASEAVKSTIPAVYPSTLDEDRSIYAKDKPDELVNFYVTVLKSYDKDNHPITMDDLNLYRYNQGGESPRLDVIIQEGDETGPAPGLFGFGEKEENGVIENRGHSTQTALQKSYRIKLYGRAGLWRDQQTINLSKHAFDVTKVRNKLSFDLFKLIPDMTSLRTTYVHLHVKDLSHGNTDGNFTDYGLYTQIEQPNKRFLRMHGLDPGGNLYKAENFEFFRYDDAIKLADDPAYNKAAFEKRLEIKGNNDHHKLIAMLDDVNNYSLNIDAVVDKYFDRNNYITWMAVNILFGNTDITTQNFYLYSPENSGKFYFLPWDYDGAWGFNLQERNANMFEPWAFGISRFWNSVLHRRFLKNPDNLLALNNKVKELLAIVTPERTKSLLDSYYGIVSRFVSAPPDAVHLGATMEQFEKEYKSLCQYPQEYADIYFKSLENPMPVFLDIPQTIGDKTTFQWDYSYDLQGDDITYDFQLSISPAFNTIAYEKKDMTSNSITMDKPAQGVYYYRVIIRDGKGNAQTAFDTYQDVDGVNYFGIMKFRVE